MQWRGRKGGRYEGGEGEVGELAGDWASPRVQLVTEPWPGSDQVEGRAGWAWSVCDIRILSQEKQREGLTSQ